MKKYQKLIGVLGWEDRFYEGISLDLESYLFESITLIRYTECDDLTEKSRELVEKICHEKRININYLNISVKNTVSKWKELENYFSDTNNHFTDVLLEISTMPRDTIWSILYFLKSRKCLVDYIYHSPEKYNPDWLSKEPGNPILLFKHSGISKLGAQTALIILTGFEVERAKQLVHFFEPKITYLGLQVGEQFDNQERNIEMHDSIKGSTETIDFKLNAYDDDHGYKVIKEQVSQIYEKYNVVIASLGPKLTSISIYKLFLEFPEIALSYVPSKEFNSKYSEGIGNSYHGSL